MSKKLVSSFLCLTSLVLLSGCGAGGAGGAGDFSSNEAAVAKFANTTWGDPSGDTRLTFNENAKLTDLVISGLPPEFAGLRIDGTPFQVTLPNDPALMMFAGQTISVSMENSKTILDADGTLTMEFYGTADIPLVDHLVLVLTGTMTDDSLSNLSGRLEVYVPFVGKVFEQSMDDVIGSTPITQLD